MIREVRRIDRERLAFPTSNRVTMQRALAVGMTAAIHEYDTLGIHPVDSHTYNVVIYLDLIRDGIEHQHRRRHGNASNVRRLERILRCDVRASFLREWPAWCAARHREETLRHPSTLD